MIRTFIYGSCVSRDTFERLPRDRFSLAHYVARQSLISALSPAPAADPPPIDTTSAFQRRMIEGDWTGSLVPALREHAAAVDLVLWDLCDERLGVRHLARGPAPADSFVTRSVDGIRAGVDGHLEDRPLLEFGSRRHRLRFLGAVRQFGATLRSLDLLQKVVVLAPAWATHATDGRATPSSFGLTPTRANRLYRDYHFTVGHVLGVPVLDLGRAPVTADPGHPWGLAPFHYSEDVYARLVEGIAEATGSPAASRSPR